MSFFGFESSLPRDRPHDARAPGFGPAPDAFGFANRHEYNDDEAFDFDDTYDGLGDQLDETDDAHNLDTFGEFGAPKGDAPIGKDFDFSGQTAEMRDTLQDEQVLYTARQPPARASPAKPAAKPARTGYERYADPGYIPELVANEDIWGKAVKTTPEPRQGHAAQPSLTTATRQMMTLEEVEASMRAQSKRPAQSQPIAPAAQVQAPPPSRPQPQSQPQPFVDRPPQILQRPQQMPTPPLMQQRQDPSYPPSRPQPAQPGVGVTPPQILQRPSHAPSGSMTELPAIPHQLRHIHPDLQVAPLQPTQVQRPPQAASLHNRGPSYNGRVVTHPEQLLELTEEERAAYLQEDAKRAKRNHKIYLLSKDNGLMTPQDKNFITRIQLQQLVTAIGNVDEQGPEAALAEDFYYQVYSRIRGAPRSDPSQPLNHFVQTYLNQTAGRGGTRRYPRGGDSHMRRMEQQVQRAVEAAKSKPKNKQLVLEGSLGKISFSNAKTPKPLLNLKRPESSDQRPQSSGKPKAADAIASRKATLRDIEALYSTLMKMEDHERHMPPPPEESDHGENVQEYLQWREQTHEFNQRLWRELKVMEPIVTGSSVPHPFIAILTHPKGKKLIPRVFRQIDDQQRLTVLTMIVVHIDMLDVVQFATLSPGESQPPRNVRDEIELFSQAVMPSLFSYVSEAQLGIVIGLVGLVMERVNVGAAIRTKIGLGLLTMFISRAEIIKQAGQAPDSDWEQWKSLYNRLFDTLEPQLPNIFPASVNSGEDTYVWQFLAAMGIGAGQEQQQRLVIAVKERVMETVTHAKTLPEEMGRPRLDNVNLFMRAIGLDVELLG